MVSRYRWMQECFVATAVLFILRHLAHYGGILPDAQDRKNLLGHQAYMIESVKSLASIKPYHMRVEWDDHVLEEDFVFGMVTNTRSVGGFKGLVNQSVSLNDGVLRSC